MPETRSSWSVLVVDDSAEFLEAACAWIGTQPRMEVVGTATDGAEAVERVAALRPDLVLMDALMPGIDGFEATRRLKESGATCRVVVVSFHDSETVRQEAWAAGADGFVGKSDLIGSLPSMLRGFESDATDREDGPTGKAPSTDGRPGARPAARDRRRAPETPAERRGAIGRAIGAFVRGLVPHEFVRRPAGLTPAVEMSGNRGGSRGGRRIPGTQGGEEE